MSKSELKKSLHLFKQKCKNTIAGMGAKQEKLIVFESYEGRQYSDNPRFISEKMHELYPDYTLVWGFKSMDKEFLSGVPEYVKAYDIDSFEYRKLRAGAAVFVYNEKMTESYPKKKGQLFIQTWHGDRGIKKILFDSLKARGLSDKHSGLADYYLTDLFVVGSRYAEERIRTAFRYSGEVLKTGCPRNDCLVDPGNTEAVREKLGIPEGKKILLYAPTLRRNAKVVQATLDIDETLRCLSKRGGEWVCLVRAHPKSLGLSHKPGSNVIDVSKYPDMADLLMAADMLITDYSSCAGDFILRKKPLVLAQFDLEQYMEEDRTFHVDIRETGFLIAHEQAELNAFLENMTDEQFAKNCEKIMEYFGTCETGHAAEDVCRWIDGRCRA